MSSRLHPSSMATTVQPSTLMEQQRSVLDDLGEEVTGIMAPVSICMAITVLLVRVLNPEGASSSATVYIASLAYNEQAGDSAGQKLGGALLNAIIFVAIVAGMTFVLFLLFKYRCYRVIYGYMGVAMFNIFFFLTGTVALRLLQTIHLHMDAFSFCFLLFNFSVVGVLGLFFFPVPLLMKQCYLVWVGVVTAFIFTYIPEWTAWVLLVLMAVYDLAAVLVPGGPLKVLVELAIERNQELPALIYEARPAQRPYNRGVWRAPAPGETGPQQRPTTEDGRPGADQELPAAGGHSGRAGLAVPPPIVTTTVTEGSARRGLFGGLFNRGSRAAAAGSAASSPTVQTALLAAQQHSALSEGGRGALGRPLGEGQESQLEQLAVEEAGQPGAAPSADPVEELQPAAGGQSDRHEQQKALLTVAVHSSSQPSSRGASSTSRHQSSSQQPGLATVLMDAPLSSEGGPVAEGSEMTLPGMPLHDSPVFPSALLHGSSSGGGSSGSSWLQPVPASSSPLQASTSGEGEGGACGRWPVEGAAGPHRHPGLHSGANSGNGRQQQQGLAGTGSSDPTTALSSRTGSAGSNSDHEPTPAADAAPAAAGQPPAPDSNPGATDESEDYEGLPDGIKLGLGDFIFYSMLVGRAAMYDMMTVFASYLAIIAGLGTTLLLLALAKKALPALPVSIVLGVMFYFLTRFTLEPFLVPLAINQAYY